LYVEANSIVRDLKNGLMRVLSKRYAYITRKTVLQSVGHGLLSNSVKLGCDEIASKDTSSMKIEAASDLRGIHGCRKLG
jgi:hypothetical protein